MKRLFFVATLLVAAALAGTAGTSAQSPPQTSTGLKHVIQVQNRFNTGPAADGTTVILNRVITREERAQIEKSGVGPKACASLTVRQGKADLTPQLTADCPEGSSITATINFNDEQGWISGTFQPSVEWRTATPSEQARTVALVPDQPLTVDQGGTAVRPPATGEAGMQETRGSRGLTEALGFSALGLGIVLGIASFAIAFSRGHAMFRR